MKKGYLTKRDCPRCGTNFKPKHEKQATCSRPCARAMDHERRRLTARSSKRGNPIRGSLTRERPSPLPPYLTAEKACPEHQPEQGLAKSITRNVPRPDDARRQTIANAVAVELGHCFSMTVRQRPTTVAATSDAR